MHAIQRKFRFAAVIFITAVLISLLLTFQEGLSNGWFSMRCAALIILYSLLLGLIFVRAKGRIFIFIAIATLLTPLYAFEIFTNVIEPRTIDATNIGVFEKTRELREKGENAHQFLYPLGRTRIHFDVEGKKYFPLGGIGKVTTVLCKEAGPFLIYKSDRYGFNNPDAEWDRPTNIALLGDSFVHGSCVKPQEHFSGILRKSIPGVLNLGMAGSGPLLKLSNIREHLKHEKPKYVFWHFLEGGELYNWLFPKNSELAQELKDTILSKYLDKNFSQNLRGVRVEINQKLISFSDQRFNARQKHQGKMEPVEKDEISIYLKIRDLISLKRTTETVKRGMERIRLISDARAPAMLDIDDWMVSIQNSVSNQAIDIESSSMSTNLNLYREALSLAKAEVHAWGGKLVFVYLPWVPTFKSPYRTEILKIVDDLGLQTIDIRPSFEGHKNPSTLFAIWDGDKVGHYSPTGYKIVADMILAHLRDDGATIDLNLTKH